MVIVYILLFQAVRKGYLTTKDTILQDRKSLLCNWTSLLSLVELVSNEVTLLNESEFNEQL